MAGVAHQGQGTGTPSGHGLDQGEQQRKAQSPIEGAGRHAGTGVFPVMGVDVIMVLVVV
jgi:hypothetical protein